MKSFFPRFFILGLLMVGLTASSLRSCLPAPPHPHQNPNQVIAEAQQLSNALDEYIKAWMDGKVAAQIPNELLPKGMTAGIKNIRLQRYEDIVPSQQWMIRERENINFNALHGYFPDPNCTYIKSAIFYAPFGHRFVMEGEFPHSRFFDIQISPTFNPTVYYYDKSFGAGEVPIVDVDIDPLPGNVNPFRAGSDRNAANRKYRVVYELAIGDANRLNPSFNPPHYRGPGNTRVASAIQYQGPLAENRQYGHGRGIWDTGDIWIRYYGVDKNQNALGGVPLPKAYYELPDGRRYNLIADASEYIEKANNTIRARNTWPMEPPEYWGSDVGWNKQFGILLVILEGISKVFNFNDMAYIRELYLGITGRGEDQPPPGSYEPHATGCSYINYLTRGMSLGGGKIAVLTGKLPTFPGTRNSESNMQSAQLRYWSITGYDANPDPNQELPGAAITSIMDDEVVLDGDRHYVIVYSRAEDRPSNANAQAGVTWEEWGPTAAQTWTLRWLSVAPEWNMSIAPNEFNLPWSKTAVSGSNYTPSLIAENDHNGFLGEYLPRVHYMNKRDFEALGAQVTYNEVPIWK